MEKSNFNNILKEFGFLEGYNEELFEKYKTILLEWNQKMNLTRITDEEEIYIKHFLDSLTLFKLKFFHGKQKVLDIGSGAGFPGIPLKIYNSDLDITLVDSLQKRITFLNEVISELDLNDIVAIHGRAEEMGRDKNYREQFDICTSRAVASLNTLCEYSLPFVKVGGHFISMKGSAYKEELSDAEKAIKILGGELEDVLEVKLPGDITHSIIVIKKTSKTKDKYPRGGGKPRKTPL